ncbi:MAG: hypothetical protein P8J87_11585 [Verrucomicrobiales bacterium]|nr:hypothetical protein [Verrucomicrobiales bacterium]
MLNFPGEKPAVGTRFDLLVGGALRGSYRSVTVPDGSNWNLAGLAAGGDGAVVYLGGGVIPQPERFEITGVAYEASPQKVTLTWPSKDGHLYLIEASTDGKDWSEWELNDSFLSQGDETRFEHAPQAGAELPSTLIYRVTDLGLAP